MPVAVSYPGVYIEELPSGVRTISGVATSITAFIGYTARGPINKGVQIFNFGDYERAFGGLQADAPLSYAVQQFFGNGGAQAIVVRVAAGAARAAVGLRSEVGGPGIVVLTASARSEGRWGNGLRIDVDYDSANPASLFNLTVTEYVDRGGVAVPARTETHRNLSMSQFSGSYAVNVINAASELIEVARPAAAGTAVALVNGNGTSTSGTLTQADLDRLGDDSRRLAVTVDGDGPYEFDLFDVGGNLGGADLNARIDDLALRIRNQVQAIKPAVPAFGSFTCTRNNATVVATSMTPDGQGERSAVRFSAASQRSATAILKLGIANGGREADAAAALRPAQTGTLGTSIATLDLTTLPQPASIAVTLISPGLANDGPIVVDLWGGSGRPATRQALISAVQAALAASPKAALNQARVSMTDDRLRIVPGGTSSGLRMSIANNGPNVAATSLGLAGGAENVTQYALGVGPTIQAQTGAVPGDDGTPPAPNQLKGSRAAKTGIFALEGVDLFNILCLPDQSDDDLLASALAYARERRAFLIIDLPVAIDTLDEARGWLATHGSLRDPNAAVYFPRIRAPDPLDGNRSKSFANCGAIAGLYARTDSDRGVWKAPAGTDAVLRGVQALDVVLTDPENGVLNPLGMNCLRNLPAFGPVAWGARTLRGSDQLASEWKYVPVRRLALFLEESLYRGTQWVVFEPNDEPLWAQIRLNVGAFMNNLFRQGAFQGRTPREAYLVKCDAESTTQNDINLGIVNIIVGFAPLKPAEFVIIKIQQLAGQIQT
jgi:uncharacterized protein